MAIFAIQKKGRLVKGSEDYLNSVGVTFEKDSSDDLKATSYDGQHKILFVRHMDIPKLVAWGFADQGIVAEDLLYENNHELPVKIDHEFDFCAGKMVIAVPKESLIESVQDLDGKKIATSYPVSLSNFLNANGVTAEIIEINGSVEISIEIGLSDAICDMTCTGGSLKKYNLKVIAEIYDTKAVLISKL